MQTPSPSTSSSYTSLSNYSSEPDDANAVFRLSESNCVYQRYTSVLLAAVVHVCSQSAQRQPAAEMGIGGFR